MAYKVVSSFNFIFSNPSVALAFVFHPINSYPSFSAVYSKFMSLPSGKYSSSEFDEVPPFVK